MSEKLCKTCKHWRQDKPSVMYTERNGQWITGHCHISEMSNGEALFEQSKTMAQDIASYCSAVLMTTRDFSCVQWEGLFENEDDESREVH